MTYTAQSCREEAARNDKFGDPIMNDPDLLRAHADALEENARLKDELAKLRHAVNLAARAMHGEGVDDQAQAWDVCLRILDAARADFPEEK